MATKRAKKKEPGPPTIRIDAIVPQIAALDMRPRDDKRLAENRIRTRIRDAIARGELKPDTSGKALPSDHFWEWALQVWGSRVQELPSCPQGRTVIEDVVSSGAVDASVSNLDRTWRPDDHEWLRRHYSELSAAVEAQSAEVQELRDRLARLEGECAEHRLKQRELSAKRSEAGKLGGRPRKKRLRS